MKEPNLQDRREFFRQMLTTFQERGNAVLGQSLRTEEFTRLLQAAWQLSVFSEKTVGMVMEKCLEQMHLPSRAEVAELSTSLQRIEDKLNQLLGQRARASHAEGPRPRGP